jgi:hypothetical protein
MPSPAFPTRLFQLGRKYWQCEELLGKGVNQKRRELTQIKAVAFGIANILARRSDWRHFRTRPNLQGISSLVEEGRGDPQRVMDRRQNGGVSNAEKSWPGS